MKGLYVIVDPEHCGLRDPRWVAEQALAGGCALLQLRAKSLADAPRLELARALRASCRAAGVPFWMNDRLDLALLVEADGLHLGQDDLPLTEARKLWGSRPIGRSTHSLAQALQAEQEGADVIGFGPVFDTQSKQSPSPTVGLAGLRETCARVACPVVAIGGIEQAHAGAVREAGASYAAVIRAVCGSPDPAGATRELQQALVGAHDLPTTPGE